MARNFYFDVEATMVSGSANFNSIINANFDSLGLTEAQALSYSQVNADLQSAAKAARDPSTRTIVSVARKNAQIKLMQRAATRLSVQIRGTPTVTDAQFISMGLLARAQRRRRSVPAAPPLVTVRSVRGRVVDIRVADRDSVNGRSKPFGARHAHLFSYVGEEAPTDANAYYFEGATSRTTMQIVFPNDVPSGATVWLSARWVSARGETSIASAPMSFTLTGGTIAATSAAINPATHSPLRVAA